MKKKIIVIMLIIILLFSTPGVFSESDGDGEGAVDKSRSSDPDVLKPIWLKEFVGRNTDRPVKMVKTSDGGYLIAATTYSFSFSKPMIWLIKTDKNGDEEWNKILNSAIDCQIYDMIESNDGDYILTGYILSTRIPDSYEMNFWLIKIDTKGNELWNRTIGGTGGDMIHSIASSPDGGYILAGSTESYSAGGLSSFDLPNIDVWMIKVNENGYEEWNRTFGTNLYEYATDVRPTNDGGYIILASKDYEEDQNYSMAAWLIKTDGSGKMIWNRSYGEFLSITSANELKPTPDGGYIMVGRKKSQNDLSWDLWLCKLNGSGEAEWSKKYGGDYGDDGHYVYVSKNNSYLVTGYSVSEKSFPDTNKDIWLIELDENGKVIWDRTLDLGGEESGIQTLPTDDGGYVVLGKNNEGLNNRDEILLFKIDKEGVGGLDYSGNEKPVCHIETPKTQEDLNGYFRIEGEAKDFDGTISRVDVRIDNGTWHKANGTDEWHYNWDSQKVNDGDHTIYMRAFDGLQYGYSYVIVRVNNAPVDKNATLMPHWGINFRNRLHVGWDSTPGLAPDGGYLLFDSIRDKESGDKNAWFAKIDEEGNLSWSRSFGGSEEDWGEMAVPSVDGGYLMVAYTRSIGQEGYEDREEPVARVWLIKIDHNGTEEWNTLIPWNTSIRYPFIAASSDGGCFVVGYYFHKNDSLERMAFAKIDGSGNIELNHLVDAGQSRPYHIQRTTDGGCIITGSADPCCNSNTRNIFLLKLDSQGVIEWRNKYKIGIGNFVQQTADGGYILAGQRTESYLGISDMIIIKTDRNGVEEWNTTIGTIFDDSAESVYQTSDGGYIISGTFGYYGQNSHANDIVIVKLDAEGNEEWRRVFNYYSHERVYFAMEVGVGDYVIAGYTAIFNPNGFSDIAIFKIHENKTGIDWDTYYDDQQPDDEIYPENDEGEDEDEEAYPFRNVAYIMLLLIFMVIILIIVALIRSSSGPKK